MIQLKVNELPGARESPQGNPLLAVTKHKGSLPLSKDVLLQTK